MLEKKKTEEERRLKKQRRKQIIKTTAAVTLAASVVVGSVFSGPDEITGGAAQNILDPEPIVLDIADITAVDAAAEEESAPEEAKKSSKAERIRAFLLGLPLWARYTIVLPLWAVGAFLLWLGSIIFANVVSPFAGVIISALIGLAAAFGLFTVTAKSLFPNIPLKKIVTKKNFVILLVLAVLLGVADVVVPMYYPAYPLVSAVVKFAAVLLVVNIMLSRLNKIPEALSEKFA